LISTPEYNNAMPGVLKNGLDWLSRPQAQGRKTFFGRPVAVIGATPGGFGTVQAQTPMLSVLRALGCDGWFGARLIAVARQRRVRCRRRLARRSRDDAVA